MIELEATELRGNSNFKTKRRVNAITLLPLKGIKTENSALFQLNRKSATTIKICFNFCFPRYTEKPTPDIRQTNRNPVLSKSIGK